MIIREPAKRFPRLFSMRAFGISVAIRAMTRRVNSGSDVVAISGSVSISRVICSISRSIRDFI